MPCIYQRVVRLFSIAKSASFPEALTVTESYSPVNRNMVHLHVMENASGAHAAYLHLPVHMQTVQAVDAFGLKHTTTSCQKVHIHATLFPKDHGSSNVTQPHCPSSSTTADGLLQRAGESTQALGLCLRFWFMVCPSMPSHEKLLQ